MKIFLWIIENCKVCYVPNLENRKINMSERNRVSFKVDVFIFHKILLSIDNQDKKINA